jgi:hypothetical protein
MSEESPGHSPSSEEIITALGSTGFLLEQRVAQKFRAADYLAIISDAFPDPETGKSREIDVFGVTEYSLDKGPVTLLVVGEVVAECKSSLNPLVVVGTHGEDFSFHDESIIYPFDPFSLKFSAKPHATLASELELMRLPGYQGKDDFVGHQLVRMNRNGRTWRADNNSIYDGILYPLVKARQHRIGNNARQPEDNIPPWIWPQLVYIFPVVVTAGQVFTVAIDKGSDPEVNLVKWATLKRSFNSNDMKTELRVDVVSFRHFSEYLTARVTATVDNAGDLIKNNAHLYDPEWLLANFGEPQHKEFFDAWLADHRVRKSEGA